MKTFFAMRQDKVEFSVGAFRYVGVSGNSKQRRLIVRQLRKSGFAVKLGVCDFAHGGTYKVGKV